MKRRKLFEYIVYMFGGVSYASILPWWALFLHWILFPLLSLSYFVDKRSGYDARTNTWRINGIKIHNSFFTNIFKVGYTFTVSDIDKHGVLTLEEKQPADIELLTKIYNYGYTHGHLDTIEGCYTDISEQDVGTYQSDVVETILNDIQPVNT